MSNNTDLQQINNELTTFFETCRKNHLTQQDIATICQPLRTAATKTKLKRRLFKTTILIVLLASAYYLTTIDLISWHLAAIGRLGLIELLPIWNWQHLKNEKCLIPSLTPIETPQLECTLCEALDHIHTAIDINPSHLKQHYIDLHTPIIIPEALHNWTKIRSDPILAESVPCQLSTNIHSGFTTTGRILSKLQDFDHYFLHFQNCEFDAMKAFRVFTPKPLFLPVEMSPVQYSWLLMSRYYNVSSFKQVELKEAVALFGQMQGSNYVRLLPRLNCESVCPIVEMELLEGEALVFTSMWDLEYKPNMYGENIAVILEMH
ncbi:hypothetical protein RN001_010767 [Aquatica leii]|uniref:Uncharacterized protein n=1 Tax=Aquatica leii TaxID=1421715 RepID=A0AAN7PA58_9COLE|nr:hypothetical protein RN001_010767 [Aquatica leii]